MSIQMFNRRQFLTMTGGLAAAGALSPWAALAAPAPQDFTFLFLTDAHIEPELDAAHGTDMAMKKARTIPADFAIQGGDHVFDALGVSQARATQLFDLYGKTEQDLGLKVYHTLGNHDIFGIYPSSGAGPADPAYGKKMYEARFGPTYYAFEHKGYHFLVLDSVGITPDHKYRAEMDATQLAWLGNQLAAVPAGAPIVVITHIPLWSTANSLFPAGSDKVAFVNGPAAMKLFAGHNVIAVLQGHVHVNDTATVAGIPYITCGAICGNWWHGTRLGTPEGFTVVSLAGGKLSTRYETYGFKSVEPQNT